MARQATNLVLLLVLMQIMFGLLHAFEEDMEMENQLKIINKTPIKSFNTDYGDILDCVEIYKQHAFDHPLLKDHKVQMRPKNIPESTIVDEYPRLLPKNIECPPGTAMIKRTTKEDLITAKKMKALGRNFPTISEVNGIPAKTGSKGSYVFAQCRKHNFGAKTIMSVWNPSVSSNQGSWSSLWIANGPKETRNAVETGWGVSPKAFSNSYTTRLYAAWTADNYKKTGCMNYLCPGFVQVHRSISLGLVLNKVSIYNGTQRDIEIAIFNDGEWWLKLYNQFIGYWPQKLFYYMYGGANDVIWGGQVVTGSNQPSPPMGSGHFPKDGHQKKSAYFKDTQIWDSARFVYPDPDKAFAAVEPRPDCYGAELAPGVSPGSWDLYYGGPGQCNL